jgi:diacylglycerol kinase family enzyme
VIGEVEAQRVLKRRWGKLFFVLVGLRQALQYRGRRVTVTVDGQTIKRRVLLALTSNTQLYGALVRMPPDARIDDGLLDVTLLHGDNALHTAWHFIRLGMGFYHQQPDVEHLRGREIEIQGATLPIHVDAEPLGATPLSIYIKPRALRVFVPETATRSLFSAETQEAEPESVPGRR